MKFALLKTVAPRQGALDRGQSWAHSSQEGATGGEVGEAEERDPLSHQMFWYISLRYEAICLLLPNLPSPPLLFEGSMLNVHLT